MAELSPFSQKKTKRKNSQNLTKVQKFEKLILKNKLKKSIWKKGRLKNQKMNNSVYSYLISHNSVNNDFDKNEIYLNYSGDDNVVIHDTSSQTGFKFNNSKSNKNIFNKSSNLESVYEQKNKQLNDFNQNFDMKGSNSNIIKNSNEFLINESKISPIRIVNSSVSSMSELIKLKNNLSSFSSSKNKSL